MADERTFEQALAELEQVVRDLEGDATGLEESMAKYEAGIGLLKFCYGRLRQAEQRILQLTGEDDEGRPQTTPFRHASAVEPDRPAPKRRRKADDEGLY
jgi:exodeoxyribonuclease VII small subunit